MSPLPEQDIPQEPIANVTTPEVLGILNHELFLAPIGVDNTGWQQAVAKVKAAVQKLNLNLAVPDQNKYMSALCKNVDAAVRDHAEVDNGLIEDPMVLKAREEIAARLRIRIFLGRDGALLKRLVDFIRDHHGKIDFDELAEIDGDKQIKSKLFYVVQPFGEEIERKKLGWLLVAEFLSEKAGMPVEFVGQRFIARKRGGAEKMVTSSGTRVAEDESDALVLPDGLSLDEFSAAEEGLVGTLDSLKNRTAILLQTLESQVAEIIEKLTAENESKGRLETAIATLDKSLQAYYESVRPVEERYARILRTFQIMNKGIAQLPKKLQVEKDSKIAELREPYKNTLASRADSQRQLDEIVAKIALLESERNRLEELKGLITRMHAGFRDLGIMEPTGEAAAESTNGETGANAGSAGTPAPGEDNDGAIDEPEDPATEALKATRALARWLGILFEETKRLPIIQGWKVMKDSGRIDDLIAQLQRMLQKKDLILTVATDEKLSGMLNNLLFDLKGEHPKGAGAARSDRKKEKGSIKVNRLNTLMDILRGYMEEEA